MRNEVAKINKRKVVEFDMVMYGKIPPQAKELEESILGSIMTQVDLFDEVSDILKPESFYVDAHQRIFGAMVALRAVGQPVDRGVVKERLSRTEELEMCGGPYYLTSLEGKIINSANIVTHARIVVQKYIARELIRVSGGIIQSAYENVVDVFDLLDDLEKKYFELAAINTGKGFSNIANGIVKVAQRIAELKKSPTHISGISSGYGTIDKKTFGWQRSDLIIIAARPSVGKTAFVMNLALNAAKFLKTMQRDEEVLIFSLEMEEEQLIIRMLANESGVRMDKIRTAHLEPEDDADLYKAMQSIHSLNIEIDDTPSQTVRDIRAKVRKRNKKKRTGLVIIDYLQLMLSEKSGDNRNDEISTITRGLKLLSKELKIPTIVLSQLSRKVEDRKGPPLLSDLRDSGSIEQDADLVSFLYRPDNYDPDNDHSTGEIHYKIAKQRNGELATFKLRANLRIQRFTEVGEADKEPAKTWIPNKSGVDFTEPRKKEDDDDRKF